MRRPVALALSLFSLVACSKTNKLDGFEGAVTMHTTTATGSQDLVVDVKGDHLRFDMKTPQGEPMHAVLDPQSNKVTVYLDAAKSYMDADFSSPTAQPSTNPDTSNIVKSGKHETIAGYDCEDWTVADASGKKSEVCIAQGIAFVDLASLKGGGAPQSALAKEFREKKSFPLRSIDYDASGKEISRSEVTKIEPKTIDDSAFAPPAGYTKITTSTAAH